MNIFQSVNVNPNGGGGGCWCKYIPIKNVLLLNPDCYKISINEGECWCQNPDKNQNYFIFNNDGTVLLKAKADTLKRVYNNNDNCLFGNYRNLRKVCDGVIFKECESAFCLFAPCAYLTKYPTTWRFPKATDVREQLIIPSRFGIGNYPYITELPTNLDEIFPSATGVGNMFRGLTNLRNQLQNGFKYPKTATNADAAFMSSNITNWPESLDISNLTYTTHMFMDCRNLKNLPDNFKFGDKLYSARNMFRLCRSLTTEDCQKILNGLQQFNGEYGNDAYAGGYITLPNTAAAKAADPTQAIARGWRIEYL